MAIVERTGQKGVSYQVRWLLNGEGPGQSRTVHSRADAEALNAALKRVGWRLLATDPQVVSLSLIGGGGPDRAAQVEAVQAMWPGLANPQG